MNLYVYIFRIIFLINIVVCSSYGFERIQILTPHDLINSSEIEPMLKIIYGNAFKTACYDNWSVEFQKTMYGIFDAYITKFKNSHDMLLVVAIKDTTIMGWALSYKNQEQAILELIAIDPLYWRKGVGKKLVFSIQEFWPEVTRISLVTRKVNPISLLFYESLGFKKINCMLSDYYFAEMQGYELNLK